LHARTVVAWPMSCLREEGRQYQVFLRSGPEDPDTVRLAQPITSGSDPPGCDRHQRLGRPTPGLAS
jgi:hypothetical protein